MTEENDLPKRRNSGLSPMGIYVPKRSFALKEAVLKLAELRYPNLPWPRYLFGTMETALNWHVNKLLTADGWDPYCDNPSSDEIEGVDQLTKLDCFLALAEARAALREALAEGDLVASAMGAEGSWIDQIPFAYWRSNDGGWRMLITDRTDDYSHTFIKKSDFNRWEKTSLHSAPDELSREDGEPSNREVDDFLQDKLRAALAQENRPTKTDIQESVTSYLGISKTRFLSSWETVTNSPEFNSFKRPGAKNGRKRPVS
ncbi:hypothetical protein J2D73_19565 [Acetobacter sacchari]|uniref:Uncharacterized protein n=1 Tax=Acetobacter sacchari TaxID=2661687 RepID=A0ABS3M1G9_9PROT|nr:hypothetical protein [Acetobacter sacchari]MBO1361984.1 hypothetical protein [Acetobacter sacchari]